MLSLLDAGKRESIIQLFQCFLLAFADANRDLGMLYDAEHLSAWLYGSEHDVKALKMDEAWRPTTLECADRRVTNQMPPI
jgi:hypothetical protein